jgi:phosphoglycerate dehydrogenase-like enzyme
MLPSKDKLTICFAHVAYQLRHCFLALDTGINSFEVRDAATLQQRIGEADVLVISGLWRNDLLPQATRLRFIQSIGAGTDQFSRAALAQHGVRLASARGVNARAVSEHVMALILALSRRLPEARDNQAKRVWRGMIGDLTRREDELAGKTLIIVGLGQIGGRLAQLAKAFDMRVIGIRRDPRSGAGHADAVHGMSELTALLPQADFVALTCPLTAETEKLIDADALGRMKQSAYLVNAARGRVVDEPALVHALDKRQIQGAALDVTVEEPLAADSPLWAMDHVLITPHTAGETCRYEDNVVAIMQENFARLWRGETQLLNEVV